MLCTGDDCIAGNRLRYFTLQINTTQERDSLTFSIGLTKRILISELCQLDLRTSCQCRILDYMQFESQWK